jgi:serine/threonine-protein kinase
MSAAGLTWVGAGVVAAVRHQLRRHETGQGWLRFWEGPLGRALFKVAAVRLDRAPAGTPYGPTELAIGIAAGRLYEALPAEQRRTFPELPEVVRRLEAHAEALRARIAALDALLQHVGDEDVRPGVATARDVAEGRLRRTVAALESIRVELLRLHAGGGSLEGVTLDLAAAKELSEDLARALEGVREVDRFLGLPVARELAAPLTPA